MTKKKNNWNMIGGVAALALLFISMAAGYTDVKEDVRANSTKITAEEKINDERYEHIKQQLNLLVEQLIKQ